MPRPNKRIIPGREHGQLDGPVSSARAHTWTKYGGPETVEGRGDSPNTVEVTVDDVTVIEYEGETASKYVTRGTSAHGIDVPDAGHPPRPVSFVKEWIVARTIEGRTYRRSDTLEMIELKD
jgi:hypothetical protein